MYFNHFKIINLELVKRRIEEAVLKQKYVKNDDIGEAAIYVQFPDLFQKIEFDILFYTSRDYFDGY